MRIFGLEISRVKAAPAALSSVMDNPRAWFPLVREPFSGAWQRNMELRPDTALSFVAVFRCISLISADIAKLGLRLVAKDSDGIWTETESAAFSPVLRDPNRYQNTIQFVESWINSKLISGNAYILKERDDRNIVRRLYVLDPHRVRVLVAPDGSVYYQLMRDELAGLPDGLEAIPASEVIHDRCNTFFHPLIGLSPLFAASLPAIMGTRIQENSAQFFGNGANPGGILTAPGVIDDTTANRLKDHWNANYTGQNVGKVAVLGDGLKYEKLSVDAVDAQLVEQLKITSEQVCAAFGVPTYKVGVGAPPAATNIEIEARRYYSDCLQPHIEHLELSLDRGLGLNEKKDGVLLGVEVDVDNLFRMDMATHVKTLSEGVLGGLMKPNEGRRKLNLGKVEGGDSVFLQQQNFSLEALAKRDARPDPFAADKPEPAAPEQEPEDDEDESPEDPEVEAESVRAFIALYEKDFREALNA